MVESLELRIERLVAGGEGLAHLPDGRAVFVPQVAPGELVRVRIVEEKPTFARGQLIEVIEASTARRSAPCPHYGDCGGCQLQHLHYAAQVEAKQDVIREALLRLGHINWREAIPIITGDEWAYRGRVQFKLLPTGERIRVGFYAGGTNDLCDIETCLLLAPPLAALPGILRQRATPPFPSKTLDIALGEDNALSASAPVAALPTSPITQRIGDFVYAYDARCFFQVNSNLVAALVREVVPTGPLPGGLALDLYAGVGLFTLPLSRWFAQVLAIEASPNAAAFARENLTRNNITNVQVMTDDCGRWLQRRAAAFTGRVDWLVVDPPRAGLDNTVRKGIVTIRPRRMTYVSCHPATLARDLKFLLAHGYQLTKLVGLDLFPQTAHVEVVVQLAWGSPEQPSGGSRQTINRNLLSSD
ncbi:class I SAM-dependent RNA methyltransferase [Chloracidobacterium validum]|uniref:Class I SAM-dependent RNA methyltransferase n=1 Tax=Chloracidobacterium validum TaxID=2821543 RepID=A0ABX8BBU6_9BACT|nr:class I SAM-dependent RNA methyltransferase [Chloracidobacterium validum]QUW03104.1 class I SAM-dependent RNA methyltransferase [Chloracidobacterium validum]